MPCFYESFFFVCMFLSPRGVVEYDAEGFTKLTLLLMWKDFCFLVHSEYTFAMSMSASICLHVRTYTKPYVIMTVKTFRALMWFLLLNIFTTWSSRENISRPVVLNQVSFAPRQMFGSICIHFDGHDGGGCYWHFMGRGQGDCLNILQCTEQHPNNNKIIECKLSTVLSLRTQGSSFLFHLSSMRFQNFLDYSKHTWFGPVVIILIKQKDYIFDNI